MSVISIFFREILQRIGAHQPPHVSFCIRIWTKLQPSSLLSSAWANKYNSRATRMRPSWAVAMNIRSGYSPATPAPARPRRRAVTTTTRPRAPSYYPVISLASHPFDLLTCLQSPPRVYSPQPRFGDNLPPVSRLLDRMKGGARI